MDAILKNSFRNILPGYKLVAETIVSTDTENISFTGLTIGKEDDYMLVSNFVNTTGTSHDMLIKFNDTNGYYSQRLDINSTSVSAERNALQYFGYIDNSSKAMYIAKIKLTNNSYVVAQMSEIRNVGSSSIIMMNYALTSTFTTSSITKITISNNGINMASGSRFQLYKRVAPIVADITVSSATTSVDITGLEIDKGSEYMLVSQLINNATTRFYLYANGNNTDTNYYSQSLDVDSSSIGASRDNTGRYVYVHSVNYATMTYSNIKLTNNGYITSQNNSIKSVGTSSVRIDNEYTTSTFTASSITSLRISAMTTNGIGVGSRFQLIKLK